MRKQTGSSSSSQAAHRWRPLGSSTAYTGTLWKRAPADREGERVAVLEHACKPAVALQAQLHEAAALLRRRQAAH